MPAVHARHARELLAPANGLYVPAVQLVQVAEEEAPLAVE